METTIRKPAVSGKFYPSDPDKLVNLIEKLQPDRTDYSPFVNNQILGGIVPHAGYVYSARHAIPFFQLIANISPVPDTIVILCPNHYGYGPPLALDNCTHWQTPLGNVEIDQDFYPLLKTDIAHEAHQVEHSAEVMLPLLQYFIKYPFRILPISMRDQTPAAAQTLARRLQSAGKKLGRKIIVIASSDFSHYVSVEEGNCMDDKVLEKISSLDIEGLFSTICIEDISVCGYGPIMTLIHLANIALNNPEVTILSRGHSGEVTPSQQVVHYISILVGEKK
jgi:MEMO1 family protein